MTRPLHIAVIDDNISDLILVKEVFDDLHQNFTVSTFDYGKTALEAMRQADATLPDLILLDINMPTMNGFEVLREIKTNPISSHIPVVMLTTSSHPGDIEQAYSLLANSYLVKSMQFDDFVNQVEAFVHFWTTARLVNWPERTPSPNLPEVDASHAT